MKKSVKKNAVSKKPSICYACGGTGYVPSDFYKVIKVLDPHDIKCRKCRGMGLIWK